jgi:hypothetical protein
MAIALVVLLGLGALVYRFRARTLITPEMIAALGEHGFRRGLDGEDRYWTLRRPGRAAIDYEAPRSDSSPPLHRLNLHWYRDIEGEQPPESVRSQPEELRITGWPGGKPLTDSPWNLITIPLHALEGLEVLGCGWTREAGRVVKRQLDETEAAFMRRFLHGSKAFAAKLPDSQLNLEVNRQRCLEVWWLPSGDAKERLATALAWLEHVEANLG